MSKCKYYLEKEVVSYDGGITWNETGVTRKGNLYEESSEDCTDPSVQYRWINMNVTTDYICDGTNKYYKQKKQVSYDGIIWQDVTPAEYQRGSIYEVNSPDCQPTYRWVNLDITTDWICDETTYTKYYKQKKQVSYGGQEWQDVIPYEYQRGSVYETQSTDCGYVPPTPQYRWVNMDISTDYICDGTTKYYKQKKQVSYDEGQTWQDVIPYEYQRGDVYETQSTDCGYTPEPIYRWTNMDISTDWVCYGTTKYYKQKKQVSNDNGQTWQDVIPYEYQSGSIYETESTDCGYVPIIYRWVNMDISTDYICDGTTKYYKQKKQISFDGGQTWADVTPAVYQRGDVYETQSTDCGYVPPVPTGTKFQATYSDGSTYSKKCDQYINLSYKDTKQTGYDYEKMTTAAIGDCITVIGDSAFKNCSGLTSVTIPNSVTYFYSYVFQNCISLKSVVIPNSVTTIGNMVFGTCKSLTSVTISNSITELSFSLFSNCIGLTGITIPNSVTSIGGSAFYNCSSLTGITIPNSVIEIGNGAFYGCSSFTSVAIPNSVTSIGGSAFRNCTSLASVVIPNSVTTIGDSAFTNCYSLTSIDIPSGVTSIGQGAFESCSGLASVTIEATTPPALGSNVFNNTNNCPIYVPANSFNAYKAASGWSSYSSRIQAIP